MSITRTSGEFARAVLDKMGLTNATEDGSARDLAVVAARYQDVLEELRTDNLVYWDEDAIPAEVVDALSDLVIQSAGPSFGFPLPPLAQRLIERELMVRRIRKNVTKQTTKKPLRVDYF